jgi:hypothetical protein
MIVEQQPVIFHPFVYGDSSVVRFFGRSELCDAMVQEIVFMRGNLPVGGCVGDMGQVYRVTVGLSEGLRSAKALIR